jgi:hypothetical protein
VVAEADDRPRDPDAEEHDEEVRVPTGQHLGRVGHSARSERHVDRVGGEQRHGAITDDPAGILLAQRAGEAAPGTIPMRAHVICTRP